MSDLLFVPVACKWGASGAPVLASNGKAVAVHCGNTASPAASLHLSLHTVVDARSGAVLSSWDEVKNGSGNSMYSGTVTLNTIQSGSSWLLKDSVGNYTTDLNGATSGTGAQFTDADNVWGNGSTSSRQTAGVDAEYGAEKHAANARDADGSIGNCAGAVGDHQRNQAGDEGERGHLNRAEAQLATFDGRVFDGRAFVAALHRKFHDQNGVFAQKTD